MKNAQQPYFVRFLENEEPAKVKTGVKAGWPDQTHKWPSDDDEYPTS